MGPQSQWLLLTAGPRESGLVIVRGTWALSPRQRETALPGQHWTELPGGESWKGCGSRGTLSHESQFKVPSCPPPLAQGCRGAPASDSRIQVKRWEAEQFP